MSLTTPERIRRLQRKLYVKAKAEPTCRFHQLYDKVYREDILEHAYRLAKSQNGASGVDGISFADIEERGEQGHRRRTGGKGRRTGTPQGGVLSPLLANIYMHRYLRYWQQQGKSEQFRAKVINYADDFVILSHGHAPEALAWTREVMTKLKLTLNETKTCIRDARQESFDFLGYTFGPACYRKTGGRYYAAQPSAQSVQRLKEKLHAVFGRGNVAPWPDVAAQANRLLRGWANYFRYGTLRKAYRAIDNYTYDRVVRFLKKRRRVSSRGTEKFPGERVFGELGIQRLRSLAYGA